VETKTPNASLYPGAPKAKSNHRAGRDQDATDGLITAVTPWAAVRAGFTNQGPGNAYVGYTGVWNVLDMSACRLPVLRAYEAKDVREDGEGVHAGY